MEPKLVSKDPTEDTVVAGVPIIPDIAEGSGDSIPLAEAMLRSNPDIADGSGDSVFTTDGFSSGWAAFTSFSNSAACIRIIIIGENYTNMNWS